MTVKRLIELLEEYTDQGEVLVFDTQASFGFDIKGVDFDEDSEALLIKI